MALATPAPAQPVLDGGRDAEFDRHVPACTRSQVALTGGALAAPAPRSLAADYGQLLRRLQAQIAELIACKEAKDHVIVDMQQDLAAQLHAHVQAFQQREAQVQAQAAELRRRISAEKRAAEARLRAHTTELAERDAQVRTAQVELNRQRQDFGRRILHARERAQQLGQQLQQREHEWQQSVRAARWQRRQSGVNGRACVTCSLADPAA